MPRYATMLFGLLASWGVRGTRKRIEFVVKAKAGSDADAESDAVSTGSDGEPRRNAHNYTVLNGSFQRQHLFSIEIQFAKPFRDPTARLLYGPSFASTDFDKVLTVVRSEITGEPAFPELLRRDS